MSNTATGELRLLLDENVSPNIVSRLWEIGIDAVHVRDRGKLRAPDYRVFQLAAGEHRAVVTIDIADFEKLVSKEQRHPGVIVIPSSGSRDEQYRYVAAVANFLRQSSDPMDRARNHIISIDENLSIKARRICATAPPQISETTPTRR
jgi:predicted nuclease of predicted toxin-antitoxin system